MSCKALESVGDVFLDGELPASQMVELQAHVDACADCAQVVAFSRALRRSLQQAVAKDAAVSTRFKARLRDAVAQAADEQEADKAPQLPRQRRLLQVGSGVMAAAAAMALWLGQQQKAQPAQSSDASSAAAVASSALGSEELLDRLIDYHSTPPAPQVTEPGLIPQLERDVGVRVSLPSLVQYGVSWQGGSVVRMRPNQRAAYLRYRTADNHTVTVYVYNASRMPLHAGLEPKMYRKEQMYVGHRRGYSIAAQMRYGVGYAVATDLDDQSAELVRAVASGVTH